MATGRPKTYYGSPAQKTQCSVLGRTRWRTGRSQPWNGLTHTETVSITHVGLPAGGLTPSLSVYVQVQEKENSPGRATWRRSQGRESRGARAAFASKRLSLFLGDPKGRCPTRASRLRPRIKKSRQLGKRSRKILRRVRQNKIALVKRDLDDRSSKKRGIYINQSKT